MMEGFKMNMISIDSEDAETSQVDSEDMINAMKCGCYNCTLMNASRYDFMAKVTN